MAGLTGFLAVGYRNFRALLNPVTVKTAKPQLAVDLELSSSHVALRLTCVKTAIGAEALTGIAAVTPSLASQHLVGELGRVSKTEVVPASVQ